MPAKRPSFLDKLAQELPEPATPVAAQPEAVQEVRTVKAPGRPDIHRTTIYIPDLVHERLREIAFAERSKVHDLLMEGVDKVIESRGHPERTARRHKVIMARRCGGTVAAMAP